MAMLNIMQKCFRVVMLSGAMVVAGHGLASHTVAQTQAALAPEKSAVTTDQTTAVSGEDPYLKSIYRSFYTSYKLGPGDEIAIRVFSQPDYSLERIKITPMGRVYHPLTGDVELVGLTLDQVTEKLTKEFSQYIINPLVSVSLLESNSAKIGVVGEVQRPGVIIMNRPMTVLDAVSNAGGFSTFGNQSSVTVLRQVGGGRTQTMEVNVKRIMQGKSSGDENIMLMAGDTVIVKGNAKKALSFVTSLVGFGNFINFLVR